MKIQILFIISILTVFVGCNSNSTASRKPVTNIQITPSNKVVSYGNQFTINIKSKITKPKIVELQLYINNKLIKKSEGTDFSISIESKDYLPGKYSIKTVAKNSDGKIGTNYSTLSIVSDITPKNLKYTIVETLPHNTSYFTEGLEFHNQIIFESTGNYNESYIKKYNPQTEKIFKSLKLSSEYFGEGITILNDKIYQLTYKAQKAFVYDVNTFEKINEFTIHSKEGWGMTNNGKDLIMSDGTSKITFLDPTNFKITKTIYVNYPKGFISNINELEYVDGVIYANIWMKNTLLKIDANSGIILAFIDMNGLLSTFNNSNVDVLNGIAFNSSEQLFYVTGKYWPKMFKVKFE